MPNKNTSDLTVYLLSKEMRMRDVFACLAMHSFLASTSFSIYDNPEERIDFDAKAQCAYKAADAMVKARKRK